MTETAVSTAVINAANALLVFLTFRDTDAPIVLLAAWLAVNLLLQRVMLLLDRNWEDAAHSVWPLRRVVVRASFLGLTWGALPMARSCRLPMPSHMLVLGVVVAGMIAGGAVRLAVLPAAAYRLRLLAITLLSGVAFLTRADPGFAGGAGAAADAGAVSRSATSATARRIRFAIS